MGFFLALMLEPVCDPPIFWVGMNAYRADPLHSGQPDHSPPFQREARQWITRIKVILTYSFTSGPFSDRLSDFQKIWNNWKKTVKPKQSIIVIYDLSLEFVTYKFNHNFSYNFRWVVFCHLSRYQEGGKSKVEGKSIFDIALQNICLLYSRNVCIRPERYPFLVALVVFHVFVLEIMSSLECGRLVCRGEKN